MAPLRRFDVIIIPEHDRPREVDNVVVTEGAPNLVDRETMRDGNARIRNKVSLSCKKRLGLLLGGDTPEHRLTTKLADRLIEQIEGALEDLDMELLMTTSRRTPKAVEGLLKRRLGSNPRCKLLLIANEKNIENAVGGILGLSDLVLVSGESISMVSEAASSGKRTIVFDLEKKRRSSKHDDAIRSLASGNYIIKTPVDGISDTIRKASERGEFKRLDNNEIMYKKLLRVI